MSLSMAERVGKPDFNQTLARNVKRDRNANAIIINLTHNYLACGVDRGSVAPIQTKSRGKPLSLIHLMYLYL